MTSQPETHIVQVCGPIRGQPADISDADVRAALGACRPAGPGLRVPIEASQPWPAARRTLDGAVDAFLNGVVSPSPIKHISLFAIAPIPLLVALGRRLGEATSIAVFNHHRDPAGWAWGTATPPESQLALIRPRRSHAQAVAVLFSLSGRVTRASVEKKLPASGCAVYEIEAPTPRPNLLRTQAQLSEFRDTWRCVLADIHARYSGAPIHLFGALPPAAAVAVGQGLMPDLTAPVHAYQWEAPGYAYALTVQGDPLTPPDLSHAAALLLTMFRGNELQHLIAGLPRGGAILASLPARASAAEVSHTVVREMSIHPEEQTAFAKAILRARPQQEALIARLLGMLHTRGAKQHP